MIETLCSREVYRNPWMTVREDDVRHGNGHLGVYGVVDKPEFAASQGCHVFLAEELTAGDPDREPTEAGMRQRWADPDEWWRLVRAGRITDAATIAAFALLSGN
jgi:hypothetical protein